VLWQAAQRRDRKIQKRNRKEKRNSQANNIILLIEKAAKQTILLTTSRRPTRRIRTFCQDLARSVPEVVRINRGKLNRDGIAERALEFNADRVIILDRWKGGTGKIKFFRIKPTGLTPVPPLMYVAGIKIQREFGEETKTIRSLAATVLSESMHVVRIANFLSDFLDVPVLSENENAPNFEASMNVSLDASRKTQITFALLPLAVEVGPRISMSHIEWEDQNES
jgi:rRNA maturation protein Rpf1